MPPPLPTESRSDLYYAAINGEQRGPYRLEFIEALVLAGTCGRDIQVRGEHDSQWQPLNSVLPKEAKAPPTLPPRSNPTRTAPKPPKNHQPARTSNGNVSGCLSRFGGIAMFILVGSAIKSCNSSSQYSPNSAPSYSSPAPQTTPYVPPPPPGYTLDQPASQTATPPPSTYTETDDSGRTFRVSQVDHSVLQSKEQALVPLLNNINELKGTRATEGTRYRK
jgi:hypothetical protein